MRPRPRRPLATLATALLALLTPPALATAQEIHLSGPLATDPTPHAPAALDIASRTDAHAWVSIAAISAETEGAVAYSALGAQLTTLAWVTLGASGLPTELRWGPWAQASMDGIGPRAEGGLALQLYSFLRNGHSLAHVPMDLRLGAGYGDYPTGPAPHLSLTFSAGRRVLEAVPWPPPTDRHGHELTVPQLLCGVRAFVSLQRTLAPAPVYRFTTGIELELGVTVRSPRLPPPIESEAPSPS